MAFPYTEMVREWNGSLVHTKIWIRFRNYEIT
jgi:hypothetical protein